MKFVVLLPDLFDAVGGIQTFSRCLVRALDELAGKRGWEVSVLALNDHGTSGLVNHYITPPHSRYQGFSGHRVRFVFSSLREAIRANVTIFGHVHFAPLAHALDMIRPVSKNYLTVYGIDVAKRLPFLRRSGATRMSKILSISAFTAKEMQKYNHISDQRFVLLPCTLEPSYGKDTPSASRDQLSLPNGHMIMTVSRLTASDRYKGVDTVIRAMPIVLSRIPDAFYVVVGDGADRARLQSLTDSLGIGDRVYFTGRVADPLLCAYYQQCDVFVLASSVEGFGIVFLEAMRFAKPCVGARAGAIPDVVENGVTGLLAEAGDVTGLAEVLARLLQDAGLRTQMGQAGRARLELEFSFGAFRARLEDVLCG